MDVHYDQATQLPNLVLTKQPSARLSRSAPGTPEGAVTEFIRGRSDLWSLTAEDAETIEVVSVSQPKGEAEDETRGGGSTRSRSQPESTFNVGNLKTVNMLQRIEGKEVFNSEVTAAVNADNEVISVAGQFFPGAGNRATRSRALAATPTDNITSEEEAMARAAFDLTNHPYQASDFTRMADPPDSGPYRFYEYKPASNETRPRCCARSDLRM